MKSDQLAVLCLALSPMLLMLIVTAAKVAASYARERRDADQT